MSHMTIPSYLFYAVYRIHFKAQIHKLTPEFIIVSKLMACNFIVYAWSTHPPQSVLYWNG